MAMAICGWRRAPFLTPLWLPRGIRWWGSSPVVVARARRTRRSTVPTTVHRTVVVAIATVVRPLWVPLIRAHTHSATCRSGRHIRLLFLTSTSGIQLVAVLIPWKFLGSCWYWFDLKVVVLQCIERIDAFLVVQAQQALEKIETFRLQMLAKALVDVASLLLPLFLSFAARQRRPTRHVSLVWRTNELENPNTLVYVCASLENWLSLEHFAEDAPLVR